ncbi:MAG: CDP-alcohol phosphatidyltransferase family protein [Candidatus Bathyarchaeota archaeon]|nr:MAG: CDP-alcohol phosphatidyltransferase family protein [Candidatus Bathyarchaeota archaeon]
MLGKLREKYQKIIAPIGRVLSKTAISPNMISLLSLFTSLLSSYAYVIGRPFEGALIIVLVGILDMLDGAIARASNRVTRFGATFDHVIDRYAEFFIIFGIILGQYTEWTWGMFSLFSMIMASFTRAKAESIGGLKSCTVGIAERQEKLIIIIGASFLIPLFSNILQYSIILVGLLSSVTVVQRLAYTWKKTGGN